jgi:hypothetical protein
MEADETNKPSKDLTGYDIKRNAAHDKRETVKAWTAVVSALGTVGIPLVLLFANNQIQNRSDRRDIREVALQLQAARETSEAQMKANMFAKLLEKYESSSSAGDPRQKLFFLELLVYNFGDTLNLSPIINDLLASRTNSDLPLEVRQELTRSLQEASSRQIAMLSNARFGHVIDTTLEIGKEKTFEIKNCIEGSKHPIQHIVTLKLIGFKQRNDALAAQVSLAYAGQKEGDPPQVQSFLVESIDLPLINNTPLRMGARIALVKKGITDKDKATFSLIAFTQELAGTRDKPTAREYIEFLEKSYPVDKSIFKNSCAFKDKPISVGVCKDTRCSEVSVR